jgi:hypothetical protein
MSIFYIKENDPNAVFVINIPRAYTETDDTDTSINLLVEFLEINNIDFYTIDGIGSGSSGDIVDIPIYKVQNCTVITYDFPRFMSYKDLATLSEKYILARLPATKSVSGERLKIYVSRGSSIGPGETFENSNPDIGYADNSIRMYEEYILEDYLKSCGFTVVDSFNTSSLSEQIQFMNSVDVLVGVTGTGLVNSIFMSKGKTIIELQVELPHHDHETVIVSDYWQLSQAKEHTYIGIDLIDKQGATAVKKLKSLFGALDLDKLN